jgi:uncharacterized protein YqeY
VSLIRKQIKELNESIEAFMKGGRTELAQSSKDQLAVYMTYLPPEISDEELQNEIKNIVEQNQDLFQKNRNAVTGIAMKQLRSKAAPERIMKALQSIH